MNKVNVAWRAAVVVGLDRAEAGEVRRPARGWVQGALECGKWWARALRAVRNGRL